VVERSKNVVSFSFTVADSLTSPRLAEPDLPFPIVATLGFRIVCRIARCTLRPVRLTQASTKDVPQGVKRNRGTPALLSVACQAVLTSDWAVSDKSD